MNKEKVTRRRNQEAKELRGDRANKKIEEVMSVFLI